MLQYSTIEPRTLEILKDLMALPILNNFYLVGGTALSLYYGHRLSVGLDLFSNKEFEPSQLAGDLEKIFPSFTYTIAERVGVFGFIDNVKVDFVKHHYFEIIQPTVESDGVRLYSTADIAAMKVSAILKRGVKKDFWDIAELLQYYSVPQLIDFYNQKYPSQQLLISIPYALVYFEDAEESESPISLKNQDWEHIKASIRIKVERYLR